MESFGRVPVKPRSVNPNSAVVRACGESSIAFLPGLTQEHSTVSTAGVLCLHTDME